MAILVIVVLVAVGIYATTLGPDDGGDGNGDGGNGGNGDQLDPAPTFTIDEIDGDTHSLEDFRGRVVVLDLFATWCGPCETQMVYLNEIRSKYPESQVVIISVDIDQDETETKVRNFKAEHNADWIFALDDDYLQAKYSVTNIPTLAVIDKEGGLAYREAGLSTADGLSALIDPLL